MTLSRCPVSIFCSHGSPPREVPGVFGPSIREPHVPNGTDETKILSQPTLNLSLWYSVNFWDGGGGPERVLWKAPSAAASSCLKNAIQNHRKTPLHSAFGISSSESFYKVVLQKKIQNKSVNFFFMLVIKNESLRKKRSVATIPRCTDNARTWHTYDSHGQILALKTHEHGTHKTVTAKFWP